ncbi:hypothetical protein M885DRAFT_580970 [Pelagophyceae sp. CCMP2097]|nr:hypothetical protein M885DRAFT_580970 [Pelagophyceae sp. CCMP2097]
MGDVAPIICDDPVDDDGPLSGFSNYDQAVMDAGKVDRNSSTKSCTAQALNKMVRFQRSAVSVANGWNKLTWWHCPDSFADPALVPKTAMTHDVRLVFLMHFFSGLMKEDGMPPDTSTFKTWVVSTYRLMKWRQQDFIAAYCIPSYVFIAVKLSESDDVVKAGCLEAKIKGTKTNHGSVSKVLASRMTANKCGTADYTKAGGWADGEAAKKSYCKVVYNFSGADLWGANFSGANFGIGSIIMGLTAHQRHASY